MTPGLWESPNRGVENVSKDSNKAKKPAGWKAFDALARKLVKVPKSEVERAEKDREKRKRVK
jgi:hypothetical protein